MQLPDDLFGYVLDFLDVIHEVWAKSRVCKLWHKNIFSVSMPHMQFVNFLRFKNYTMLDTHFINATSVACFSNNRINDFPKRIVTIHHFSETNALPQNPRANCTYVLHLWKQPVPKNTLPSNIRIASSWSFDTAQQVGKLLSTYIGMLIFSCDM